MFVYVLIIRKLAVQNQIQSNSRKKIGILSSFLYYAVDIVSKMLSFSILGNLFEITTDGQLTKANNYLDTFITMLSCLLININCVRAL